MAKGARRENQMAVGTYLKAALSISIFLAAVGPAAASAPTQATNLYPADGELILGEPYPFPPAAPTHIYTVLVFDPGATAVKHVCYFSDDYADVAGRVQDANLGPPPYPGTPGYETTYYAGMPLVEPYTDSLVRGTVYYWAVDETDAMGNTFAGDIWEFAVQDWKAFEPDPPNEAVDVETIVLLSWLPGFGARCHAVHLGTSWDDVNDSFYSSINPPPEFLAVTTEPNILVTGLSFNTKYYWRVDEPAGRSCCLPPPFPPFCGMYYKGDVWCFTTEAQRIFVDVDADGANNGASWENAYKFLQDALIDANSALKPVEMWIAEGIYTPDSNSADPNGSGDRTATFHLINGVTIKGGYAGSGQPNPDARDIEVYETILSGDLDGNDGPDFANNGENSYSIVTGSGTDANAFLDGFTITAGNANKPMPPPFPPAIGTQIYNNSINPLLVDYALYEKSPGWDGGGMYNDAGSPTLSNCTLRMNWARLGGGMNNHSGSSPKLTNCNFIGNASETNGAGLYNDSMSNPILTNCTFTENSAGWIGGAFCNLDSSLVVSNCMFIGNSAEYESGGMSNLRGKPVVTNCTFRGNSAEWGGAMHNYTSSLTLTNCTFSGNSAEWAGAMFNYKSSIIITNCRFIGNVASGNGGGMYNRYGDQTIANCTLTGNSAGSIGGGMLNSQSSTTIINSILWRNNAPSGAQISGNVAVSYSDVEGGWAGFGNIDADPCFVDAAGGDLRLSSDSPCIDTGDNNAPNLPPTDFDGHPRIIDGDCNDTEVVDMGAYEFNYAYMGDFDYNCRVNFADLSIFGSAWTSQPGDFNWDFACNISIPVDNVIDKLDLAAFADNWLAGF